MKHRTGIDGFLDQWLLLLLLHLLLIIYIKYITTNYLIPFYICLYLLQKYIENWLFGIKKPSVENRLEALEVSMQKALVLLEDKNNISDASHNANSERQREHDLLRAELKTIKSLLLNKYLI